MSGAKGKGGTGRGTDKKGWNRWQAGEKKKLAKKVFGRNKNGKSAEGENGKPDAAGTPNAKSANMTKGSTAFKGGTSVKSKNTSK
ncbi:hypothetical protein FHS16_003511 [Paenibacillus endophyticus]|uniref:DUF3934 domain-containing protein n=1 Tax=Paenibacillus endophyticus TaxID=1294268 RepID=A0A7W5CA59_9BACL|nr:DUF3934 family protein [Paenibacillus endophyticus]MBB3153449.1 hypothetical protein [Paenibacillus endophyticus]